MTFYVWDNLQYVYDIFCLWQLMFITNYGFVATLFFYSLLILYGNFYLIRVATYILYM